MIMEDFIRLTRKGLCLLVALSGLAEAAPLLQTTMASRFLARGETSILEVAILEGNQDEDFRMPMPVPPKDVQITPLRPIRKLFSDRRRAGVALQYEISSYAEGRHVIPPFSMKLDGVEVSTAPVEFSVFNPDELKWSEAGTAGESFRYAASFRVLKDNPYEGEAVPVEIKLYVPAGLLVEDWGVPEFERDGVTCWRFEPSDRGLINLLGRRYVATGYPSTLTATRSGTVAIGPANLRLVTVQTVSPLGERGYVPVQLAIPRLEFQARKLPEGAPEGFTNAVGNFTATATTTQTEVREGDPVSVDITISGTGNFSGLTAPKPINEDRWKIYESGAGQRGDERRQESGTVTFRQFMRPLSPQQTIPPFRLVYFDPELGKYKETLTEPIALTILPGSSAGAPLASAAPPQAAGIPIEKMTDILGLIQPAQLLVPINGAVPNWAGHAIAGLIALWLAVKAIWLRLAPRLHKDPTIIARRQALRELERSASKDHTSFLRQAGRFIELWLGEEANRNPAVHAILEERDASCYRSEPTPETKASKSRRHEILQTLRKSAWLWIAIAWFGLSPESHATTPAETHAAATAAYDSADYDRAIQLWLGAGPFDRLSADTLFDIGNASYRLGSPGHAALYYRRAILKDSSHAEARQNLRFIERKFGAITVKRDEYQYAVTQLRLETWKNIAWTGGWLVALALLTCLATRPGATARVVAVFALIAGPMLIAIGSLGLRYYPDDSQFAPIQRQAVVIGEKVTLHADASRTSPEVIDAPPGSLCEILKERGTWAYVGFASNTRGWIPIEQLEKIVPQTQPTVPKIPKPKADGRSA